LIQFSHLILKIREFNSFNQFCVKFILFQTCLIIAFELFTLTHLSFNVRREMLLKSQINLTKFNDLIKVSKNKKLNWSKVSKSD